MIDICLFLLLEQLKVVRVPTTIYITLTQKKVKIRENSKNFAWAEFFLF